MVTELWRVCICVTIASRAQTEVTDDIHEDPSLCDERTEHSRTSEFNTERHEVIFYLFIHIKLKITQICYK